jgi:hypothetical protein
MPEFSALRIPPPQDGKDFERLCLDLWRAEWNDPHAQLHGRSGQGQRGVDIYGRPQGKTGLSGIQCKARSPRTDRARLEQDLRADIQAARAFDPPLDTLLVATTLSRDEALQTLERQLDTQEQTRGGFRVQFVFWEEIVKLLGDHIAVAREHFPDLFVALERPRLRLLPVPKRPAHYVKRNETASIIAKLLIPTTRVGITGEGMVGIQGMGGIGKTVLAAEVARDAAVTDAFSDGVLWLPVGQDPDIVALLRRLAEALGDPAPNFRDVVKGKAWVQSLFEGKRALLVLDDVWTPEVADSLNVVAGDGRLLLTTRNADVVTWFDAVVHRVELLSDDDALMLLAEWADQPLGTLPSSATEVARACGNLPLALAMIGAMVRQRSNGWVDALERLRDADLQSVTRAFPDYAYANLLRALAVSVDALEPTQRDRYLEWAVFSREPIPEAALVRLWGSAGLKPRAVRDLIIILLARSLAKRDSDGRLSLHDLQHAFISRSASDVRALHRRLVEAYRSSGPWHELPDDGYFHDHLVEHCLHAEFLGDVRQLFATDQWMHARLRHNDGDYYGYVRDLDAAWAFAFERACGDAADRRAYVGWCFHLALVRSTISSLADDVVVEAVVRAVAIGAMPLQRAIVVATRIPSAFKRVRLYANLLANDLVPPAERGNVIAAVWRAYNDVGTRDFPDRGDALLEIAEVPSTDLVPRILAEMRGVTSPDQLRIAALLLPRALDPQHHAEVLEIAFDAAEQEEWGVVRNGYDIRLVAPFFAESIDVDRLALVLDRIAEQKEYGWDVDSPQATALSCFAPALRGNLLDRAIAFALAMDNPYGKACALAALAHECGPDRRRELLHTCVEVITELPTESWYMGCPRSSAVAWIQTELEAPLFKRLFDAVLAIDNWHVVDGLRALAGQLDAASAEQVVASAETRGAGVKRRMLAVVADKLDDARFRAWFEDAVAGDLELFYRVATLESLLPRISLADTVRLYDAIFRTPPSNWGRVVVPRIPEELVDRYVSVAATFSDDDREFILGKLSPRATATQIQTILAIKGRGPAWRPAHEVRLKLLCAGRASLSVRKSVTERCWEHALLNGEGRWYVLRLMTAEDVSNAFASLPTLVGDDEEALGAGLAVLADRLTPPEVAIALDIARKITSIEHQLHAMWELALRVDTPIATSLAREIAASLPKLDDDSRDFTHIFRALVYLDLQFALSTARSLRPTRNGTSTHISIPRMIAMRELLAARDESVRLSAAEVFVGDMEEEGEDGWTVQVVTALEPIFPSLSSELRTRVISLATSATDLLQVATSYAELHSHLSGKEGDACVRDLLDTVRKDLARAVGARSKSHLIRPPDDDEMDKVNVVRAAAALLPLIDSQTTDELLDAMWETTRSNAFLNDLIQAMSSILTHARPADHVETIRIAEALRSQSEDFTAQILGRLAAQLDEWGQLRAFDIASTMGEQNALTVVQGLARAFSAGQNSLRPSEKLRVACIRFAVTCSDLAAQYGIFTACCRRDVAEELALVERAALHMLMRKRSADRSDLCMFLAECVSEGLFEEVVTQECAAELIASIDAVCDQWHWP